VAEGDDSEDTTGSKSIKKSKKGRKSSSKVVPLVALKHNSSDTATSTGRTKSSTMQKKLLHTSHFLVFLH